MGNKNFCPIAVRLKTGGGQIGGKPIAKTSVWLLVLSGFVQPVFATSFEIVRPQSPSLPSDKPIQPQIPHHFASGLLPNEPTPSQAAPSTQDTATDLSGQFSAVDTAIDPNAADMLASTPSPQESPTSSSPQARLLSRTASPDPSDEPNHDLSDEPNQTWQTLKPFYHQNLDQCTGIWQPPVSFLQDDLVYDGTIKAQADYGYYGDTGAKLRGRAVLQKNQSTLWANAIDFDPKTGQAHAKEAVNFAAKQNNDTLMGGASQVHLNTQTGLMVAENTAFASTKINAHGYAKQLTRPSADRYRLSQAIFSTCPPNHRLWQIDTQALELDTQKGRAVAKNATLKIKNVPVFYLPYFNFPLNNRRATGFLLPKVAFGSKNRLRLSTPYYLNLAPNYDATITPTVFANKNPMLGVQLRYLGRLGFGEFDTAVLPKDGTYHNKTRHHLFFDHTWQPTQSTQLYATYRKISDAHYLNDFEVSTQSSPLSLPRRIGVSYQQRNFVGDLRFEGYQRLAGENRLGRPILDKDRPYQKLPALSLSYQKAWHNLLWSAQNNSTYFKKSITDGSSTENSGLRIYNNFSVSHQTSKPWGAFSSKFALTGLYTAYDKDSLESQNLSQKDGSQVLLLPSLRLDASLFFAKQNLHGASFLTPRFSYFYTPYQHQEGMPNFDSSLASRSYRRLFMDSGILGYDRIADQNALSTALEYQHFDAKGEERIWAAIGKQWQFVPTRTRLNDQDPIKDTGVLWQFSAHATNNLWLEASGATRTRLLPHDIQGSVHYQPYQNFFVRLGLNQQQNPHTGTRLSSYQASFALPVGNRWQVLGHTQYDKNFHDFVDSLFGIYYNDCCMGFAVYGRAYRNELVPTQKTHSIMAELKLTGLGNESRLSTLLKERVVGYRPLFTR